MNISLKLKTQTKNETGLSPLFVRIRQSNINGKSEEVLIFTSLDISSKYFKKGALSTRTPDYLNKQKIINAILTDIERVVASIVDDDLIPNPSLVKKRYKDLILVKNTISPKYITFWKAFEEFIETKKNKSYGYRKTFNTLKNQLKDFEVYSKTTITFDFIVAKTQQFQMLFQNYLWEEKELSNAYINKLLDNFSLFLYYSFQQGYIPKRPKFKKNDVIISDEKIYLYIDEVKKLFKTDKWNYKDGKVFNNNHIIIIEDILEGPKKSYYGEEKSNGIFVRKLTNWELVKDIFLWQCAVGCRYSDVPLFKLSNFNFDINYELITWLQQKTGAEVSVGRNDISRDIFKKYSRGKHSSQLLFPKLSNQKFNKSLKLLLEDLGFNRLVSRPKKVGSKIVNDRDMKLYELISSHAGRRTFIKNMIDIGTMDYKTIMKMSGHKTISEFEKYVSVSKSDIKKGMRLYQMDNPKTDDEVAELIRLFVELNQEDRRFILNLSQKLNI